MKKPAFFLVALCSGALWLASCNRDKAADISATDIGPDTNTAAVDASAAGGMAGPDHSTAAKGAAGASLLMASMNGMMSQMTTMKVKGNVDHDFARIMLEHHKGAVAMADLELRDGKDATMRRMAGEIKADQLREITALEAAVVRLDAAPANYKPADPADPFTSKMNASMDGMMQNMSKMVTDPDMNFNMLMTVHHQSAVDMARAMLAHGKDGRLKAMARLIVDAQQKEIAALKDWHNQNIDKMKP